MSLKYEALLSPKRVGSKLLRNRIITPPTGMSSTIFGGQYPSEEGMTLLSGRAKNGAAMVCCGGPSFTPVSKDAGGSVWNLYDEGCLNAQASLIERIHMYGSLASVELFNAGVPMSQFGVSKGEVDPFGNILDEMPEEEMQKIAEQYAKGALAAKNAGYDCMYLHFAHGWAVGKFLSPLSNTRTDKYGGSIENRARFPMMIIDAVRKAVGRDTLIEVRLSGTEYEKGGLELEEAIEFTSIFQEKIDLINVSCGMHNSKWFTTTHPCSFLPPMPNVYLAEAFKKSGKIHIPVIAVGGIQNLEAANRLIEEEKTDFVAIARGFIADDELGTKAYEGNGEDVRPCIKCMRCHDSSLMEHKFYCSVNPKIGMEDVLGKYGEPAKAKKKVAVIGAGPAGMQAAITAFDRGHDVTLYEKEAKMGGAINYADYVQFKYPLAEYRDYMVAQVGKRGIDVHMNTEATPEMIKSQGFDVVISAVGARPFVPPIKGIDGPGCMTAVDMFGKEEELGQEVVVIGGGQVGCETALHLAKMGKKVTVVEMQSSLAPDASPTHRMEVINEMNWEPNISYIVGAKVLEIGEAGLSYECIPGSYKGVEIGWSKESEKIGGAATHKSFAEFDENRGETKEGKTETVKADNYIVAAGMKSLYEESDSFIGSADIFIPAGDCVKPRTVEKATHEAYYAALNI